MNPPEQPNTVPRKTSMWLGFAMREFTKRGTVRIRICWGRVSLLFLVLGCFLWIGKSLALYYFFREIREFEDVSIVDMIVFPINRTNVRIQQGNYQVDQGIQAIGREDYRRAFDLLREGLARSPENSKGRMELARIYQGWRPDLATELLVGGIEHGKTDPAFVGLMFGLLLSEKEDFQVLEMTEALLDQELEETVLNIVRIARLQAAMFRGRFDIAKDIFAQSEVKNSLDGILLGTELYLRSGRDESARKILESILETKPRGELGTIYVKLIRMLMDAGEGDRAREVALDYGIHDPMGWNPRIMMIEILDFNGLTTRRDMEINAFLLQNRKNEEAMGALARICARQGNVETSTRLYEIALENGFDLGRFTLLLVESCIRNDQPEVAIGLCNELAREDPAWMVSKRGAFNAIRSLAYFQAGNEELGNLYLREFLETSNPEESTLYQAARSMQQFGFREQTLQILTRSYSINPKNEIVLSFLVDVEMDLGAYFSIAEHMSQLFELRRPGYDLMDDFRVRLQSDRFLFTTNRPELLRELTDILAEQEAMNWDIWAPVENNEG